MSRIEDMTPQLLRLTPVPPTTRGGRPDALSPAEAGVASSARPLRGRRLRPQTLRYADFLRRQNTIDRQVRRPTIPYSDYLRSLPPRPKPHAPAEHPAPRQPAPLPSGAPTLALKLADIPPPQATRREIELRTTYRAEVPLTSGRLIDIVM